MAVTVSALSTRLLVNFAAEEILGFKAPDLARAVAQAYVQFLPSLQVRTFDTGVVGSGQAVSSIIQMSASVGEGLIEASMQSTGIGGFKANGLASAVSVAVANTMFQDATVNTTVSGVSNGAGIGTLAPVPPNPMIDNLKSTLPAAGIRGPKSSDLADGLGTGIAQFLQTAVIVTADAGSPVPPGNPSSGTGSGSVS